MGKLDTINRLIENNRFIKKKEQNPNACPCYTSEKCHPNLSDYDLICLFCVCPEYNRITSKGGCNIKDPINLPNIRGKWFDRSKWGLESIWDCSDCGIPHTEKFVRNYLEKLSTSELENLENCNGIQDLWNFFDKIDKKYIHNRKEIFVSNKV